MNFRGLVTEKEAKLEFALEVLHGMPEGDNKVKEIFTEARQGQVLPEEQLAELEKEALEMLPVYLFIPEGEEAAEKGKKFSAYRDKILKACNVC